MDAFLTWSDQQDCLAEIKHTEAAGNGLFSKQDVKKDTSIIVIPFHQILSSSKALEHQEFANTVHQILAQSEQMNENVEELARSKENESLVLMLFLIYARFVNTGTDWAPYIDILPSLDSFEENHFLFKDEVAFRGTCLEQIHKTKTQQLMQEFESFGPGWTNDITFDMYQWAYCCFWSRVVALDSDYETQVTNGINDGDKVMLPMFDFANHTQEPNMRWKLTHKGVELVALEDIDAHQQLFISYGDKPNQELIFLHGFTIKDNPVASRINLSILPMLNDDASPIQKINCLKSMGLKPMLVLSERTENTNILYQVGWSQESVTAVHLVALEDEVHFESGDLYMGDDKVDTAEELTTKVKKLAHYPLIQLRTIVLLLDGLEYLYSENKKYRTGNSSCYDDYRDEEAARLEETIESMSMERDKLMEHPVVIDFINSM
jgi:hypothetical protein